MYFCETVHDERAQQACTGGQLLPAALSTGPTFISLSSPFRSTGVPLLLFILTGISDDFGEVFAIVHKADE